MRGAWQTPHGARPNREGCGIWVSNGESRTARAGCEGEAGASRAEPLKKRRVPARCAKLPGRSLEPSSNGRPRGMTVTAVTPYKIRLIDPASLVALIIGNDVGGFQF